MTESELWSDQAPVVILDIDYDCYCTCIMYIFTLKN